MINKLFNELSGLEEVESIALGGSRSGEVYDEKSDYDVYIYITAPINEEVRRSILSRYCTYMEIGNHYWEYEDNCILNNGLDIDLIYRNLDSFCKDVADVAEKYQAHNGYTTCMWHNLLTCKIVYDRNGRLSNAKKRFDIPYPDKLQENIIKRNADLLFAAMPAYNNQIKKAADRNDRVSIVHRTAAFLESYFDIIMALNRQTHPGEKRLIELCVKNCSVLPDNFENNLEKLFIDMSDNNGKLTEDINAIVSELKPLIKKWI